MNTSIHYVTQVKVAGLKAASSVAMDIATNTLYWTNKAERVIYKSDLINGQRSQVIRDDLDSPEVIAIDWLAGNLYWADSGTDFIEVATVSGSRRKVLVHRNLGNVTSLALDMQSR